jgi:hypothetical protein
VKDEEFVINEGHLMSHLYSGEIWEGHDKMDRGNKKDS